MGGGGRERGGPTRAQPYASFMRTPEDTHLPVGGVRRARSDLVASYRRGTQFPLSSVVRVHDLVRFGRQSSMCHGHFGRRCLRLSWHGLAAWSPLRLSCGRKVLAPVVSLDGHDAALLRRSLELN